MGNTHQFHRNCPTSEYKKDEMASVDNFKFLDPFEEDSTNGLYFNNIYLPEEVVINILSYVPEKKMLKLSLVCKRWCNIVKSENLWMCKYNRAHNNKAKKLPWYIFYSYFTTDNFNKNLLKNGNGQERFKHWKIVKNYGKSFKIENSPEGSDPLPLHVPDFNDRSSCFATSFDECNKVQEISLRKKRLLRYILNNHMPHIYVSEWVAGRFDCGCKYKLVISGYGDEYTEDMNVENLITADPDVNPVVPMFQQVKNVVIEQWHGSKWEKVEITLTQYGQNLHTLLFEHEGRDTQFWMGHYGSKMAGGVVKILFDSIQPLGMNDESTVALPDEPTREGFS